MLTLAYKWLVSVIVAVFGYFGLMEFEGPGIIFGVLAILAPGIIFFSTICMLLLLISCFIKNPIAKVRLRYIAAALLLTGFAFDFIHELSRSYA